MAISDAFGIGVSGLMASQAGLDTVSNNIANVNTPGYSREQTQFASGLTQMSGGQYFGSGVNVVGVTRSYNQVLTRNVQVSTAAAADESLQSGLASQLDSLIGSSSTGLGPVLQDFFNSIEQASADPTSLSARSAVISQGQQLTQGLQALSARLQQIQSGIRIQAGTAVGQINSLANQIAKLNQQIVASGPQGQPNNLLDQRDQLITQLAQQVGVTTSLQDDGSLNVFVGSGQALVIGASARQLALAGGTSAGSPFGVQFVGGGGGAIDVTSQLTGGTLGGLLTFQNGMLADAQRQLDQLALGVASQVNAQHALGMDLQGKPGGPFFNDINSPTLQMGRSTASTGNQGDAALAVNVDDVSQLQDSSYRLSYDGASYSLTRLSDDTVVTSASLSGLAHGTGFSIAITSGSMAAGDSFTIDPAAGAANQIQMVVPNPQALALASPVRSAAGAGNRGNATIGPASPSSRSGNSLPAGITLTYSQADGGFDVTDSAGSALGILAYNPATDSGNTLTLGVVGYGDIQFNVGGTPQDGDTFSIAGNVGGIGDNSNALALSALQNRAVMLGGSATFAEQYGNMVADVGNQTQALGTSSAAQQTLLSNAQNALASYAGVNLDEEAANLLRFQQSYQASAKVIAAASDLFQTLLNAVGG